jgi:hypothetical protein
MIISIQLINRNDQDDNRIMVNGHEITPEASLLIRSHSPDGFAWGYHGSGPSQAALAICLHLFGPHIAPHVYQNFKVQYVAIWKEEGSYTVDITGFYKEFVEPNMPDYMAAWMDFVLAQLMVATDDKAFLVTHTIDSVMWSVKYEVKNGLAELRTVCDELGYTVINQDGTWFVTAKFPLTDVMVGLCVTRSVDMFCDAMDTFADVLGTAAKNISKIA